MRTKLYLIILIYLAAQNFFNPLGAIPEVASKFMFYLLSLIGLWFAFISKKRVVNYPRKSYIMLMCGIVISVFSVWLNYDQSLSVSIMTTLPYIFGYSFLYLLLKYSPDIDFLLKFIKILVICSAFVFLANLLAFPNTVFGEGKEEFDMSRGMARLGVWMTELVVFYMFYSISQYQSSKKKKWIFWSILTGVLVVFSLTRQVILLGFAFSILMILQKAKLWKKIFVTCVLLGVYQFVLPQIPIYQTMTELSEMQAEMNSFEKEDIRITAWRFYTDEYQKNEITRIIGNGLPSIGNSKIGNQFDNITNARYGGNGCYFVDVGWAGFYWLFGIFATLGLLIILIKALIMARRMKKDYYVYWIMFILITSVASAPIIFYGQVVSLCIILYMIFANNNKKYEINSVNNTQLQ